MMNRESINLKAINTTIPDDAIKRENFSVLSGCYNILHRSESSPTEIRILYSRFVLLSSNRNSLIIFISEISGVTTTKPLQRSFQNLQKLFGKVQRSFEHSSGCLTILGPRATSRFLSNFSRFPRLVASKVKPQEGIKSVKAFVLWIHFCSALQTLLITVPVTIVNLLFIPADETHKHFLSFRGLSNTLQQIEVFDN